MGGKILCIDDSVTIRMLLKKTLEPEGFEVIGAENGQEGLTKAREESIDLYLVDVNMPVMDGFEFVKNLKSGGSSAGAPIVFLTTESSVEKKELGRQMGISGWIVKPFDPPSLIKVVNMLLAKRSSS
jgi:two-component system chemotaxis response regulator CheY